MNSEKNVGEYPWGSGWTWLDVPVVLTVPQVLPNFPLVFYSSYAIDLLSYPNVGGFSLEQFNGTDPLNCFGTYSWL